MQENYDLLAKPAIRTVSLQSIQAEPDQIIDRVRRPLSIDSVCSLQNDAEKVKLAKRSLKKLKIAAMLCFLFMAGEFVAGWLSNSVAVCSDALHMLSDLVGLLINIFGLRLSLRKPSHNWTFGYERVEIISAIASIFLILLITGGLCYEASQRIVHPPDVDGLIMIIVAVVGVSTNVILGCILKSGHGHGHFGLSSGEGHGHSHGRQKRKKSKGGTEMSYRQIEEKSNDDEHGHSHELHGTGANKHPHKENISVQSAYLHTMGDLVQNVGVLTAGIMIYINPKMFKVMDPICTFCFAVLVFVITIPLVCRAFYVLMETAPKNLNAEEMVTTIAKLDDVQSVRDFHLWNVGYTQTVLSAKLDVKGQESLADDCKSGCHCAVQYKVREKVLNLAADKGINHCNLDIIVVSCAHSGGRERKLEG
jgi:zinc transporter 2